MVDGANARGTTAEDLRHLDAEERLATHGWNTTAGSIRLIRCTGTNDADRHQQRDDEDSDDIGQTKIMNSGTSRLISLAPGSATSQDERAHLRSTGSVTS